MCGIALLFDNTITADEHRARMQAALTAMRHRGPDDGGIWQEVDISIGHRRLSIIDQAGSKQPMISPDGRYVLSFNGEIYNYQELRPDLESGWQFQTHGDT